MRRASPDRRPILLLLAALLVLPMPTEAGIAANALARARAVMQSAFQLSFLPSLPVIFHRDTFDAMMAHTQKSIDEISRPAGDRTITRADFQDDKALHIKKSAELALHLKSLIGSAHLAYGITMVVGLLKEAIDGSFLNPNGSRSREDLIADHVGARAAFGPGKFDASLDKHLGNFVKPSVASPPAAVAPVGAPEPGNGVPSEIPFTDTPIGIRTPANGR